MYIDLTNYEMDILYQLSQELTINPVENPELYCSQSKELSEFIPIRIKELMKTFAKYGSPGGYLLFSKLFFDKKIPTTPYDNNCNIGCQTLLSRIQSILLCVMGEIITYEAECDGAIFQDIIPVLNDERSQTSTSSKLELEIHTEQAFSKLKPDIVSLACHRGDIEAITFLLTINDILDNISLEEFELLFKPLWMIGIDVSFLKHNETFIDGPLRGPFSILNGSVLDPVLIYDQDLMKGLTSKSNYLLLKIIDIYYSKRNGINLLSGDIIFIDNNRNVHGRSAFSPKYNGEDRFVTRCFATLDYNKSEYARTDKKNLRKVLSIYS
jgi:L-asparagine oxygenase